MIDFVQNPNLPSDRVTSLICGTDDEYILDFFHKNKIEVILIKPNENIDSAVSTHADMSVLHIGADKILVDKNQTELIHLLKKQNMEVLITEKEICGNYPDDIKLNFAVAGDCVIGNFRYSDELVQELFKKKQINVKQGYCKCSVLVVSDTAIITDDLSIYQSALKNGFEALLIKKGDVSLPGHEYGFIGGASGKISEKAVVFFGDITKHCDYKKIRDFLNKYGCGFVCTDNKKLRDIGGIIPFKQRI